MLPRTEPNWRQIKMLLSVGSPRWLTLKSSGTEKKGYLMGLLADEDPRRLYSDDTNERKKIIDSETQVHRLTNRSN